jgi:hypothetical protein
VSVKLAKREALWRLRMRHRAARRAIKLAAKGYPATYGKQIIQCWALVGELDREIQSGWRDS